MPKAVLIDLSGTLHVESDPTPGAVDALKRLRTRFAVRFVSNTTKESTKSLVDKLNEMGFAIERSELFTSLVAARHLVESRRLRPHLLLEPDALAEFQGLDTENPNCVVVGLAPSLFNYESLTMAMRILLETKGSLIAIHKGRYLQRKDGLALGPGPFVAALEYATDVKAEVVGKPSREFFGMVLDSLGCKADECLMIGDDVRDDCGGAIASGIKAFLVRTGKYRSGDETRYPDIALDGCFDSFAHAVDHLLQQADR